MYAYIMVHLLTCQMLGQAAEEAFYREFLNPPRRYSPLPIWYWNSGIDPTIAKQQIDEYVQQGAQGAIVYPDVGLKTPFLSDDWWHVWAEILPYARAKGFVLGWVPEFNDPDGDARDVWRDPPNQSRVADGHPEFRLRRLAYV